MDQLLKSFGIEWKILIWQVINFAVVFFILSRFLYKPLKKAIHDREKKISASLDAADKLKKKSKEMEDEFKQKMADQRKEIEEMHVKARAANEKLKSELRAQAEEESKRMITEAKTRAEEEKKEIMVTLESEVKMLAIALAGKVLEKEIDEAKEKELMKSAISALKSK
ncbi:MAG: ATP synthase F0 subunit B [Candidatus Jacksonbacteria bacterium RIFOXYA2_FULL_44_7]|uniref:ATP synthase subunit b n=1 Tax=Candidatus Jacksonbacteria bacterium RIFCSPLOWO2_02_FULL_44_20 TaxID=1798460 RepID=A0A1G2A6Z3_9BACT|nr:MAG: ATP synthase subunit b [Parcubacteria group bacterium GW2011_GWC2_44_17]KKT49694.1 MAG: ATP synthase subunit b [Parcubacteria group bacterium GW2011_GWF2_44_17]OGY71729.1 MAG: ATP synthase F0 subunit B [Candidatus Jacksonbacteria bacterium RIFCSPHIGHO2_02_FULL_44_25]OGY72614.1 MAG: ATP synthase F0 subunit B [Candidatus Jacksonbacteria bacterium RIFCSPLOWO2_02_FULL_44_20]OGY73885.1 MAG: ATP synthase F0 subunit B [Candidatus Jacksonbacteria bacterium RIFCSPLOWO2_12_FULL_44_15b]OGY76568.1